jgi:hypothetical protein
MQQVQELSPTYYDSDFGEELRRPTVKLHTMLLTQ